MDDLLKPSISILAESTGIDPTSAISALQNPTAVSAVVGSGLVLAIAALVVLFRQMNAQAKTNADDLKEVVERVSGIATNIGVVLANWISSNEARTRAFELSVQNQQLTIAAQNMLTEKVKDLREDVAALRTEISELKSANRQLEKAISQRGVKL